MSCLLRRILQFKHAITFSEIKILDENGTDVTSTFAFSWSTDGVCWTAWTSYDNYLKLAKNVDTDFYLKILITGNLSAVYLGSCISSDYTLTIESTTYGPVVCDDDSSTFLVYSNLDCALLLQQQLTDAIICMLGIPVYYFRVEPISESEDYTFKEFTLHNITAVKQIKLMLEDGSLPSSNPHLSDFDFDWETDWPVEVSKTHFANAFGDTAIPKQRDIIYVPLMKRLWMVNSAYDEKQDGLMWRSTTFKLALRKYEINTNLVPSDFDSLVDSLIVSKEDAIFGDAAELEQVRTTGYAQVQAPEASHDNYTNIFMSDGTRKSYTKDLISIKDQLICQGHTVIARNMYEFAEGGTITYSQGICGNSGVLSFIVETPPPTKRFDNGYTNTILSAGPINFEFAYSDGLWIGCDDLMTELAPGNKYLVIYRWCKDTYVRELSVYYHWHRTDIPLYRLSPEQYYFDTETPVYENTSAYNLDYDIAEKNKAVITCTGYPLKMTNIKLYNIYLNSNDVIKECLKYVTDSAYCVFNDCARPITTGAGVAVR